MISIARQAKRGFAKALVEEVLTDRVMAIVLPTLISPLISEINREISVLAGRPVAPRSDVRRVDSGLAAAGTRANPADEAELVRRLEEYQDGERDESLPGPEKAP